MGFLAFEYILFVLHQMGEQPFGLQGCILKLTNSLSQQPTMVPKSWIDGSVGQFLSQIRDEVVGSLELGGPRLIPQIMRRVVSYTTHNTPSTHSQHTLIMNGTRLDAKAVLS